MRGFAAALLWAMPGAFAETGCASASDSPGPAASGGSSGHRSSGGGAGKGGSDNGGADNGGSDNGGSSSAGSDNGGSDNGGSSNAGAGGDWAALAPAVIRTVVAPSSTPEFSSTDRSSLF